MINLEKFPHNKSYQGLAELFKTWSKKWDPVNNQVKIEDYFGEGIGIKGALKALNKSGIINSENDFKGIYVFFKAGKPFYVGISKHVVERIMQHVKGKDHFSSSFCYRLGRDRYRELNGKYHEGGRKGLDFEKYVEPAKKELMKCSVAIMEIDSDLELYLFEVFMAMELGTLCYNEFRTH